MQSYAENNKPMSWRIQLKNTIFCKFSLKISGPSLAVCFSHDDERKRLFHATARSVGGSMTLNLDIVSLWVTLRNRGFPETAINAGGPTRRWRRRRRRRNRKRSPKFPEEELSSLVNYLSHPGPHAQAIRCEFVSFCSLDCAIKRQSSNAIEERVSQSANCFSPWSSEIARTFFCTIVGIAYLSPR